MVCVARGVVLNPRGVKPSEAPGSGVMNLTFSGRVSGARGAVNATVSSPMGTLEGVAVIMACRLIAVERARTKRLWMLVVT